MLKARSPGEPLLLARFGAGGSAAIAWFAGGAEAVEGAMAANCRGEGRRSMAGACGAEVMGGAATAEVMVRVVSRQTEGDAVRLRQWVRYARRKRSASDERLPRRRALGRVGGA